MYIPVYYDEMSSERTSTKENRRGMIEASESTLIDFACIEMALLRKNTML